MRFKIIGGYGWWLVPHTSIPTSSPPPLDPLSVKALFDAAFYGTATPPQSASLLGGNITGELRTFIERHNVDTVIVLPVGRYPSIVTASLTAALGKPSRLGGVTAWFHAQRRIATSSPSARGMSIRAPVTNVLKPTSGSELTGTEPLVASAAAELGVKKVEFRVTGNGRTATLPAVHFLYGWIAEWNSNSVPRGAYTVSAEAQGVTGLVTTSTGVPIEVGG